MDLAAGSWAWTGSATPSSSPRARTFGRPAWPTSRLDFGRLAATVPDPPRGPLTSRDSDGGLGLLVDSSGVLAVVKSGGERRRVTGSGGLGDPVVIERPG